MKSEKLAGLVTGIKMATICAAIGGMCWLAGTDSMAQTPPPNVSPALQQVVSLSKGGMTEEFILDYIAKSNASFNLGVDEIIYLHQQGVSDNVIKALRPSAAPAGASLPPALPPQPIQTQPVQPQFAQPSAPQPPVVYSTPAQQAPPPGPPPGAPTGGPPAGGPEVNFNYFHDQLSPFGTWIDVGGVMYWRPDKAIGANPDWRPYYDMGQWVQTDNGLYWQSDYNWGDNPLHYGRWVLDPRRGWLWAPDYEWGPAWVFWRHHEAGAAIGWAPLPVGAVYLEGGLRYRGVAVGAEFDFGLGETAFVFVDYDHFHEGFRRWRGHEWGYHYGPERIHGFYGHTVIRNEFRRDEHGRFVNNGIGRERMERVTHVEHAKFEERRPVGDRNALAAAHPAAAHAAATGGPAPGAAHAGGPAGATPAVAHAGSAPSGPAAPAAAAPAASKVFRPPAPAPAVASAKPAAPAAPRASGAKGNKP